MIPTKGASSAVTRSSNLCSMPNACWILGASSARNLASGFSPFAPKSSHDFPLLVAQFNVLQVLPVAHKVFHRVFARAKQVSDGGMNRDAEHQPGAFDPRPQLLDVVEAVLLGAG